MKRIKGTLAQKFTIKMNHEAFIEKIEEYIRKELYSLREFENSGADCTEVNDSDAVFEGSYKCRYDMTYYPATWESPAEEDVDRVYLETELDLDSILKGHEEELIKLLSFELIEDAYDVDYDV